MSTQSLDVLSVELSSSVATLILVDGLNRQVVGKSFQTIHSTDDLFFDSAGLDFRLAGVLEVLFAGLKVTTVPQGIALVVPTRPPDILTARYVSAIVKFRALTFENEGGCDGSLRHVHVVPHTAAVCVACASLCHDSTSSRGNAASVLEQSEEHHIFLDFQKEQTVAIAFTVFWEGGSKYPTGRVVIVPQNFVAPKLPLDRIHKDPYLASYIEPVLQPFLSTVVEVFDQLGVEASTKIRIAVHGLGADCVPVQELLNKKRRLQVWIPAKAYQETTLAVLGGAIVAAGSVKLTEGGHLSGPGSLRIQLLQSAVSRFSDILRVLVDRVKKNKKSSSTRSLPKRKSMSEPSHSARDVQLAPNPTISSLQDDSFLYGSDVPGALTRECEDTGSECGSRQSQRQSMSAPVLRTIVNAQNGGAGQTWSKRSFS